MTCQNLRKWPDGYRDLRCAESKTRYDRQLLSLSHVQLPDTPDGKDKDEKIRQDVGHDERLEDQDLIHAVSDTHERPLLLDRIAQKDENEGEDDCPGDDNSGAGENPKAEVSGEHPPVEVQLTQFEAGQSPEIDQGEGKGHLSGQLMLSC